MEPGFGLWLLLFSRIAEHPGFSPPLLGHTDICSHVFFTPALGQGDLTGVGLGFMERFQEGMRTPCNCMEDSMCSFFPGEAPGGSYWIKKI